MEYLKKLSFNTGGSNSHIIPIIFESDNKLKKFSNLFLDRGFYVKEIRYPTVSKNKERIRLSITANMKKNILTDFLRTIREF